MTSSQSYLSRSESNERSGSFHREPRFEADAPIPCPELYSFRRTWLGGELAGKTPASTRASQTGRRAERNGGGAAGRDGRVLIQ